MKKQIKISEQDIVKLVAEATRRILSEAENGGWTVEDFEARKAYEVAVNSMGEETVNNAIIRCMSDETLAQCLAYIFTVL